jgi:hypothetical protein
MPRGSKPGERRGRRKRGTPNKTTALRNAAISAANDTSSLPLDFLLRLMRDPNLALDLRVDLATTAAPFVHGKPKRLGQAASRSGGPSSDVNGEGANSGTAIEGTNSGAEKGINSGTEMQGVKSGAEMGGDSGTEKAGVNSNPEKGEAALARVGETAEISDGPRAPETIVPVVEAPPIVPASRNAADLSPLDFLLSVMNDPQAPPRLRIKAARVTAPYVHAKAAQAKAEDEPAIEDPYGFTFDLDVATALRDDLLALQKDPSLVEDAKRAIEKRIFERQMTLPEPPAAYEREAYVLERGRLPELEKIRETKRPGSGEAKKIEAEAVILTGRIKAFEASLERPNLRRLGELTDKLNGVGLTPEEARELHSLFDHFTHLERPQQLGDVPPDPYWAALWSYMREPKLAEPDPRPKSTGGDPYWAAARSYRHPPEVLNKFGPPPISKSTEGDPYWAAARNYRKMEEREASKKSKR